MDLNKAHQKARAAMKRREEEIEIEELEGGEINLIPYLDIVTNLMLFLLASISTGLILGQINTTLPDKAPPSAASTDKPETPPDERPLGLVVWVDAQFLRMWAQSPEAGLGSQQAPALKLARLPNATGEGGAADPLPQYDFKALNDKLHEVAMRWKDKPRGYGTYRVTLVADSKIPYGTIIQMMDAVRCKWPAKGEPVAPCILPRIAEGENGAPLIDPKTKQPVLIGPDGKVLEGPYNPDTMALFHEIVFSPGLQ